MENNMTNLILINKKDVTSHENTGSAFLSFDTRRVIKKPRWYVNNSNQMRSEVLKPMADNLNLDTKDILVKSSLDAPEISTYKGSFYWCAGPLYIFFSVDDFRNNKGNNLLDYLINERQSKLAEKSIKENENLKDDDSDSKGGFFSKFFGKK